MGSNLLRLSRRFVVLRLLPGGLAVVAAGAAFRAASAPGGHSAAPADEPVEERVTATSPLEALTEPPVAPPADPSAAPTPPEPEPLQLIVPDAPVPQAGSFVAIVTGAGVTGVTVWFNGRPAKGVPDGGGWLAFFGTGQRVGTTTLHPAGPYDVQATATLADGTTRTLTGSVTVSAVRFPVENIDLGPSETALLDPALTERETAIMRSVVAESAPARLWDGYFLRPTRGEITDVFGSRRSYNGGPATGSHSGVDFGADAGDPVRAAATGRVAFAAPLPVRGNSIMIDHGAGVFTGYHHLSAIEVAAGQDVRAGDLIGRVGATGLVTGPHLHWEVIVGGYQVNGLLWLQDQS